MKILTVSGVKKTYSSRFGASRVEALKNVTFDVEKGEFVAIMGESGSGKTTLLNILAALDKPSAGKVTLDGMEISALRDSEIAAYRRDNLGFVFQDFRLIPSMTVYENIAFVLRVIDAPAKYIRKRVPYVISLVGLHAKTNSYPDELSGGEKQRVAIARALVNDPQLIIADEPTGNIDPELSYEIVELLKSINDQGTTILMVTHEHDLVRHFGGRIISITEGEIVFDEVITGATDEPFADIENSISDEDMAEMFAEAERTSGEETLEKIQQSAADDGELSIDNMTADDVIAAIGGDTLLADMAASSAENKDGGAE